MFPTGVPCPDPLLTHPHLYVTSSLHRFLSGRGTHYPPVFHWSSGVRTGSTPSPLSLRNVCESEVTTNRTNKIRHEGRVLEVRKSLDQNRPTPRDLCLVVQVKSLCHFPFLRGPTGGPNRGPHDVRKFPVSSTTTTGRGDNDHVVPSTSHLCDAVRTLPDPRPHTSGWSTSWKSPGPNRDEDLCLSRREGLDRTTETEKERTKGSKFFRYDLYLCTYMVKPCIIKT